MTEQQGGQSQQQQSISGGSQQSRADRIYESEEIIIKAKMLESEYLDKALYLIERAALTMRAKMALSSVACMGLDKNAVLANNVDIDQRVLRYEEALNKAKLSYTRPDVMNPDIVYIHENLRQAFRDFVSRSVGMNERKMQAERKVVSDQRITPTDSNGNPIQTNRRHGFDLIKEKLGMG